MAVVRSVGTGVADQSNPIEFLNRTTELSVLRNALQAAAGGALIIIRSPAGYGKSSLTDKLSEELSSMGFGFAAADPYVRVRAGEAQLHDGFFIQRCAEALDRGTSTGPGFQAFLKTRRWRTARNKSVLRTLRTMPGPQLGYATAVEYVERLLSFGRFNPNALLTSDQSEAVAICRDYVERACTTTPIVLVVREAQHIDGESLRFLLQLNGEAPRNALILEYTTDNGGFRNDHDKLLGDAFDSLASVNVIDLLRLERSHFERLLARYTRSDMLVSGRFYAQWDGDVRSLKGLRFQVGLGQRITDASQLSRGLADPRANVQGRIEALPSPQRFALACLSAHKERIARGTLAGALVDADPDLDPDRASRAIDALVDGQGLLSQADGWLAFVDEDGAAAAALAKGQAAFLPLAERILRDHYLGCLASRDFSDVSAGLALRQAFRLCARSQDTLRLLGLLGDSQGIIRKANDPEKYLEVLLAVLRDEGLPATERAHLQAHASMLAYDIVDFERAAGVLAAVAAPTAYQRALLAQCHVETGLLAQAAVYADEMKRSSDPEEALHAELVEAEIALVRNQWIDCRNLARASIERHCSGDSPLVGHAFRILESTLDYPECIDVAMEGVRWYRRSALPEPLAYAEVAAARHLARSGEIAEARRLLDDASAKLEGRVRDRHLLWTARGAIGLLERQPDFDRCVRALRQALRSTRDDFSEAVIRSNLGIACWKSGDLTGAVGQTDLIAAILDHPRFSDRHVFWPICYNAAQVLRAAGMPAQAATFLDRPATVAPRDGLNPHQWAHRYGEGCEPDPRTPYLHTFDYYPIFLSHWQVDREALAGLTGAPMR